MKTAMILAAGRGERLRPLTDTLPKAMCTINNIPLIEYHIVHLAKAGFERVIINHAHLGSKIRQHLTNGARFGIEIIYSPEPPGALESGGGIANALPLLGSDPFLTVNADIFTDYDFKTIQFPPQSLAHLVLVHTPSYFEKSDFSLTASGQIVNDPKELTFAGIACYHPSIFEHHKPRRYSITPILRALATNNQLTGELHHGVWFDIGTAQRLQLARQYAADNEAL